MKEFLKNLTYDDFLIACFIVIYVIYWDSSSIILAMIVSAKQEIVKQIKIQNEEKDG